MAVGELTSGPGIAPGYLSAPPPIYPPQARRERQEGIVLLAVLVSERGTPTDVNVVNSSGYPLLDRAAMDTVRRWQFVPARIGNRVVSATAEVPIRFSLSDARAF
jgi:protein TonB